MNLVPSAKFEPSLRLWKKLGLGQQVPIMMAPQIGSKRHVVMPSGVVAADASQHAYANSALLWATNTPHGTIDEPDAFAQGSTYVLDHGALYYTSAVEPACLPAAAAVWYLSNCFLIFAAAGVIVKVIVLLVALVHLGYCSSDIILF
ncbi:hypothetical protein BDB00DRAFT_786749 [Zychaea mexicana]|uniref:uncharacterized protein n=1 Tax=Zychaea mexicana TaxID=64656 RepID=UPI0022FF417D|nr:uncharacterized protein BDB00DRAFT_786749 [Zychaea mexicana]KAI9494897.1 hypothetical protein BDB00DRAFT_786749 [Zychaea mexicana]